MAKRSKGKIIVFCAHSDDQIIGVGGTLAKYAAEGKTVITYIFSIGEFSHVWLREKLTADMRFRESKAAGRIVGSERVYCFGLSEKNFDREMAEKGILGEVVKIIKMERPEKIFTHSRDDLHAMHRKVLNIVKMAAEKANYKGDLLSFDVWNPLNIRGRNKPRLYIDITETFGKKMEALRAFRSQWQARAFLTWTVYLRAWLNGLHLGKRYAERFYKER